MAPGLHSTVRLDQESVLPRSIIIAVLVAAMLPSVFADAANPLPKPVRLASTAAKPAAKSAAKPATKTAPTSKTQPAPAKVVKPALPALTRIVETQLSGFTSQDAGQLYTRISLQETRKRQNWYIRGALSLTETKSGKSRTDVTTGKIDSRLERITSPQSYMVVTGVLSSRGRNPASKNYPKQSGYQFLSYGLGRTFGPKAKGDIGLGVLQVSEDGSGFAPALMCAVRGTRPISKMLSWESDILVLQPVGNLADTKIDSEIGLIHDLSPGLSLRLIWTLNNLVRSINSNREWDSGVRVSISYRHTTTK
jgi:hypothetical protein